LSSSPELFLQLRDGHVVTRPIKGTRPRIGDCRADAVYRRELIHSDKDRAELTMIIDLLRNDLGRVCSFGTVRVTEADKIEEHPTVFHRVATIEGDLKPGNNWLDLMRAAFPGGSVTGAPKIRAMQIIDELEPTPRGVYCGSIGWIGLDGSLSFNIAIRTMVQVGDLVHVYAGGAIVADSTPEGEYKEIIAKAAGMLQALGCEMPKAHYELRERGGVAVS
jgi:para-aminobenzoate synthetase component 1